MSAFRVVRNGYERWSVWPAERPVPPGWAVVHGPGSREHCLQWIHDRPQTPWILRDRRARSERGPRVFVFPHSGGAPGEFLRWADQLPAGIRVVHLPARGRRLAEPAPHSMDPLVAAIVTEVAFRPPYVFFGHSLGALVAYEVSVRLAELGLPLPEHLVVSACGAPWEERDEARLHTLGDIELMRLVQQRYGGIDESALLDQELMELTAPAYRADLAVYETYRWRGHAALPVPVTALAGSEDDVAPVRLLGWREATTGPFQRHVVPGGHFYFRQAPGLAQTMRVLTATLNGI
ncbi:alpha/beta fold hydrolase [Luedemannella helvata]|uniref:Alpha/beta fold hydrolase n=1 Tax=Luedemannella helvata TaxID=349315 RepID=A0ABP4X572_9ACTN